MKERSALYQWFWFRPVFLDWREQWSLDEFE